MANGVYTKAKEGFIGGDIDIDGGDIRAILIDVADYTVNLATHQFLSSVPGAARVGVTGALAGKTITDGVFDATDPTINAVTGDPVEAVIVYLHTGSDATARLISYHDTQPDGTTPIALTPNGGNVTIQFDSGTNRILRLA